MEGGVGVGGEGCESALARSAIYQLSNWSSRREAHAEDILTPSQLLQPAHHGIDPVFAGECEILVLLQPLQSRIQLQW